MAPEYIDQHGVGLKPPPKRSWLDRVWPFSWIRHRGRAKTGAEPPPVFSPEDDPLRRDDPEGIPEADISPEQQREALKKFSRYRDQKALEE